MTDSFASRSVGGNRTTAALASKRALVNKKGRCQRMSSIRLLLVGELILHTVNQSSFELSIIPDVIYQTQYLQRHDIMYVSTTLQLPINASFRWIQQELENQQQLCWRYYPKIYPFESDTPAPSVRPPIVLSKTLHLTPFGLACLLPWNRSILKRQLQNNHFSVVGWHTLDSTVVATWFRWSGLRAPKTAVDYSGDVPQATLNGTVCLVRGWGVTNIHVSKRRSGFWWAGGWGYRIWICECVKSYWGC